MTSEDRKRKREEENEESEKVKLQENPIIRSGDILRWKFENLENWDGKLKCSDEIRVGDKFSWKLGIKKTFSNLLIAQILPTNGGTDWLIELKGLWRLIKENDTDFHHEESFSTNTLFCNNRWCYIGHVHDRSALTPGGILENNSIILEVELDVLFYDFLYAPHYSDVIILNVENTMLCFSKEILCMNSKFFYNKYFVEKDKNELKIEDYKCHEICHFLGTMCSVPIEVRRRNYSYLMKLAETFDVASLHYKCQQFLIADKDIELIDKIGYAEKYSYERLMKTCVDSLKSVEDVKNVTKDPSFKSLTENTQLQILKKLLRYV